MKVKTTILSMILSLGVCMTANALPIVTSLPAVTPISIVSIPGEDGRVDLAGSFEYGNSCEAANTNLHAAQSKEVINIYATWPTDMICVTLYDPVSKWTVFAGGLDIGDSVTINGKPLTVEEPEIKACIQTVCEDGSQRDIYTCACANGFTN